MRLELKVSFIYYIFYKVIFSNAWTHSKTHTKNLEPITLNPYQKVPVVESVFYKIASMDSRPEDSIKDIFLWTHQNFQHFFSQVLVAGCALLKRCYTLNFFKMFY